MAKKVLFPKSFGRACNPPQFIGPVLLNFPNYSQKVNEDLFVRISLKRCFGLLKRKIFINLKGFFVAYKLIVDFISCLMKVFHSIH